MKNLLITLVMVSTAFAGEFTQLFNGKDFTNWGGEGKTEKSGYVVKDGVITSTPKCNVLMTDKEYSNYTLEFEFKLTEGANNGLGIHYPGEGDAAYVGMELQILDNTAEKYAKLKPSQYHGSLYKLAAAKRGALKPIGEWNEQVVTVKGPMVTVVLNGVEILKGNLDDLSKENPEHTGAKRRKGKIAFCGHGDVVSFRKIRIHESE